jgi:hypothetical protein
MQCSGITGSAMIAESSRGGQAIHNLAAGIGIRIGTEMQHPIVRTPLLQRQNSLATGWP